MFTAIQDFVTDSFSSSEGSSLDTLQMGDLTVWVEYGLHATLAVVIKGSPPLELRETMRSVLFEIHAECKDELESFVGETTPFAHLEPVLQKCLLRQEVQKKGKGVVGTLVLLLLFAGVLGLFGYYQSVKRMERKQVQREVERWESYIADLREIPGVIISGVTHDGTKKVVYGLRDTFAPTPTELLRQGGYSSSEVQFDLRSYISLEEKFVHKRLKLQLAPPPTVNLMFDNGKVTLSGEADAEWIERARTIAPALPGVLSYNDRALGNKTLSELLDLSERLERFYFLFQVGRSDCSLTECQPFSTEAPLFVSLDDRSVGISISEMVRLLKRLQILAAMTSRELNITLVGRADSSGLHTKNITLSDERGLVIKALLLKQGLAPELFTTESKIEKLSEELDSSELPDEFKRGTSLRFAFNPPLDK